MSFYLDTLVGTDKDFMYMFKMKQKAGAEIVGQKITRETFNELGKNIEYLEVWTLGLTV